MLTRATPEFLDERAAYLQTGWRAKPSQAMPFSTGTAWAGHQLLRSLVLSSPSLRYDHGKHDSY